MNDHNEGFVPGASVILPVYNAGKYLEQSIDSILSQTYKNFELLLLDDGSTDGSKEVLEHYAVQDARCKVFSWPNQGLVKTLNEGIRLAKADIIFRMDADDVCLDLRFEKQIDYLSQRPECVAVGSKVLLIDEENLPLTEFSLSLEHDDIDARHLAGYGGMIVHPAAAIRKKALIKIGGYHEKYQHAEDLDLFLRLAEVGKLANLPDVLLKYRQHVSSIGYAKKSEQLKSNKQAVEDAKIRRGISNAIVSSTDMDESSSESTIADVHRKWAWWALSAGNLKTARKYMIKSIKNNPFNFENLHLLICVLRRH